MDKLKELTLADLRTLHVLAFEFSVDEEMRNQYKYWHSIQLEVEKEIHLRIVDIFGEPEKSE